MMRTKPALVWILRIALLSILLADFLWAYLVFEAYRGGGVQGIRDHFSFSHLRFDVRPRSPEELVHEAQKGYEVSALVAGSLLVLTWLGFRAYNRVDACIRQHRVPIESGKPSQRVAGG